MYHTCFIDSQRQLIRHWSSEESAEAICPCTDIGLGQSRIPLTDKADVGDVVVLLLPAQRQMLAVVDGDYMATLLCMRDASSNEWWRDDRAAVLEDIGGESIVKVIFNVFYSQR